MNISLFDTVEPINESDRDYYGKMVVREIRNDDEAMFYGTHPIMCRTESGGVFDFREDELQIVS